MGIGLHDFNIIFSSIYINLCEHTIYNRAVAALERIPMKLTELRE